MKILVTGSEGFLAGHLIELLQKNEHKVIGLARHYDHQNNIQPDVQYLGDVKDAELVNKAVSMSDGVINLAGILGTRETVVNPMPSIEVNIQGALNVFQACENWGVPCVQITVGNYQEINSYSITKSTAERFAQMYARYHGVKINVVRALNAYGPRQKSRPVEKIIPTMILRALKNEPIKVYGDGEQLMDMVYVGDVANVLYQVLIDSKKGYGNVFEAGTGEGLKVKDIAEMIIGTVGSKSKIEYVPMRVGEKSGAVVVAKNPYPVGYTPFLRGIKKTVDYYRNNIRFYDFVK